MVVLKRSYDCILIFLCYFTYEVFCITNVNSASYDVKHTINNPTSSNLCGSFGPEDPVQVKLYASFY